MKNFVSIFFDGNGTNSKAVDLYQVINISNPIDLIFNLRIKISDLGNEGFPVAALTFMDDSDKKVFGIILTPDKHSNLEANDCLYSTRNGSLEDITISPFESARKRLPLANYVKVTKAKVSFYIKVQSGYRCRQCTIEVYNISLRHGERRN